MTPGGAPVGTIGIDPRAPRSGPPRRRPAPRDASRDRARVTAARTVPSSATSGSNTAVMPNRAPARAAGDEPAGRTRAVNTGASGSSRRSPPSRAVGDPGHPGRHDQGETVDRRAGRPAVGDRADQARAQLLRAVGRHLPGPVAEGRVGEPRQRGLDVPGVGGAASGERGGGRRLQRRQDLVGRQHPHEPGQRRVAHRGVDGGVAGQGAEVGERRVEAVDQPQLASSATVRRRRRTSPPPGPNAGAQERPRPPTSSTARPGRARRRARRAGRPRAAGRRRWWRERCGRPPSTGRRRGRRSSPPGRGRAPPPGR